MYELALFAGGGGGLLASRLLGWRTVCAVEVDAGARRTLLARQSDGCLDGFPIWDDIRTFDGYPWRGHIDIVSGGFPCQDISSAGPRTGLSGSRSGLVYEMLRVIREARPTYIFAENSPNLRTHGLGTILHALGSMGYVGRWGVLGASHLGAPHKRERMWIVAYSAGVGRQGPRGSAPGSPAHDDTLPGRSFEHTITQPIWRPTETWAIPRFEGMDDGMAGWVDRVRQTGNGQVPIVAAAAWRVLSSGIESLAPQASAPAD